MTLSAKERVEPMMKIWGMLSSEEEHAGFDLVLDKNWYAVLLHKGKVIAKFDPRDYTAAELSQETKARLQEFQHNSKKKLQN